MVALAAMIILDTLVIAAHFFLQDTLGFFDLDRERSLKAVWSGFKLMLSGTIAGLIVLLLTQRSKTRRDQLLWAALGGLFLYLAVDDMMMLHERIGFVLNRRTGWHGAFESFNWLIYYSPFIAAGTIVLILCVRALFRIGTREGVLGICGLLGFFGTLTAEMIGGQLLKTGALGAYRISFVIEEAILLFGESFILISIISAACALFEKSYSLRVKDEIL